MSSAYSKLLQQARKRSTVSTPTRPAVDPSATRQPTAPPSIMRQSRYGATNTKSPTSSPLSKKLKTKPRTPTGKKSQLSAAAAVAAADVEATTATAAPSKPPQKRLPPLKYRGFVEGFLHVKKAEHIRPIVYGKLGTALMMFQKVPGAKSTRILRHATPDDFPLSSATQMPTEHVEMEQYFHFPGETKEWVGRTIKEGRTRKIQFSMLVESDIEIETLVNKVAVDLLDHDIQLNYSKCQTISSEARLTFICLSNKFAEKPMTSFIWSRLNQIQKQEYTRDVTSELGQMEARGLKMPKIVMKKDYPYNGIWETRKDGVDTSYKIVWILMCSTDAVAQVERAVKIYKRSGLLSKDFGPYANVIRAPEKDAEDETGKEKYHEMLLSSHSVQLSMGILAIEDLINPDVEVEVTYWKRLTRASDRRPKKATVRSVLHSLTVPGADGPVQVFHGMCRKTSGNGYEAAVSSIVPLAYSLAKNISQHAAGWLYGYLKELGWSKESITKLLTKSFHTESVRAAQESSWDRKTGVVTSTHISEEDQHLRQLQNSWVDLNLGRPDSYKELDATVEVGDMMAFNFEEALSLKSLNTTNSGLEGYDDTSTIATHEEMEKEDELEEEYTPEEEVIVEDVSDGSDGSDVYDDPEEDMEALFQDAKQDLELPEGYEPYQPPQDGMEEDLEEEGVDEMDEGYVDDIEYEEYDPSAEEDADDEDFESLPIRALFPDTDEFRENLQTSLLPSNSHPPLSPWLKSFMIYLQWNRC